MQEPIILRVDAEELASEAEALRAFLKGTLLPERLVSLVPGPYGLTRFHLGVLSILENLVAELRLVSKKLSARILADRDGGGFGFQARLDPTDTAVSNLYGLFVACHGAAVASTELSGEVVEVKGTLKSPWVRRVAHLESGEIARGLVEELSAYLDFHRNHPDPDRRVSEPPQLAGCAAAFLGLLSNSLRAQIQESDYERYQVALEHLHLEVAGRRYRGLKEQDVALEDEGSRLLSVWPADVVGNQEYLAAALRLARDVAGFDLDKGQNPKRLNPVLFGQGAPGCGKTMTAHAVGNYFLKYCKEREVPARFLVIRRTDWASSFQNASATALIKIFREQVDAFPGVVGVYWPDIDTAFAARTDPGLHSEESNILGASFGIFDGTLIPKNGKWFLLCDANFMNMDEATMSRISQDPHKILGPVTPEEYVELMRDKKLAGFVDLLPIEEDHWLELGQMCIDFGFSGRNVESICQKVLTEIQDVEPPPEYYHVGFEERIKILRTMARPLTHQRFQEILRQYKAFEKAAEAQNESHRFNNRVKEIVLNLSAQKAAAKTLEEV